MLLKLGHRVYTVSPAVLEAEVADYAEVVAVVVAEVIIEVSAIIIIVIIINIIDVSSS